MQKALNYFHKMLLAPPVDPHPETKLASLTWKYGFLLMAFIPFALQVWIQWGWPSSYPRDYSGLMVASLLISNHLAFSFWFGPKWTFRLRVFTLVWTVVALCAVSHALWMLLKA